MRPRQGRLNGESDREPLQNAIVHCYGGLSGMLIQTSLGTVPLHLNISVALGKEYALLGL